MHAARIGLAALLVATSAYAQTNTCAEAAAGQPVSSDASVVLNDAATTDDFDGVGCLLSSPTLLVGSADRYFRILLNPECTVTDYSIQVVPSQPGQDVAITHFFDGCVCDFYRNDQGPGGTETLSTAIGNADNSRVIGVESTTSDLFELTIETLGAGCTLPVELLEIEVR